MLKRKSIIGLLAFASLLTACANGETSSQEETNSSDQTITVYSGRNENFIKPFFDEFEKNTGIKIQARYGDSAELAAQILEEGTNSPADVFLSQDAGAIGAVAAQNLLSPLDKEIINVVPSNFVDPNGLWVGITGRARVVAYNTDSVSENDVPKTIDEIIEPKWKSKVGIAPSNASFQSFVTAMRQIRGDEATLLWLKKLTANDPQKFEKNGQIVEALDSNLISLGLVNHYYIYEIAESLGRDIKVKNGFFEAGDVGNLLNVSAFGILQTSTNVQNSLKLLEYLLSESAQQKFVAETFEYSLIPSVNPPSKMPKLEELQIPNVSLGQLSDIGKTQELLVEAGLL
ncbi:MAG: hypothetical protein RLZZ37_1034 [Actinomycetota bacterium]